MQRHAAPVGAAVPVELPAQGQVGCGRRRQRESGGPRLQKGRPSRPVPSRPVLWACPQEPLPSAVGTAGHGPHCVAHCTQVSWKPRCPPAATQEEAAVLCCVVLRSRNPSPSRHGPSEVLMQWGGEARRGQRQVDPCVMSTEQTHECQF